MIKEPLVSRSCRSLANRLRMALRTIWNCASSLSSVSINIFLWSSDIRDSTCRFKRTTESLGSERVRRRTGKISSMYSFISDILFPSNMLIHPKAAIFVGTSSLLSNSLVKVSNNGLSSKSFSVSCTIFSISSLVRSATRRISDSPSDMHHIIAPRISE